MPNRVDHRKKNTGSSRVDEALAGSRRHILGLVLQMDALEDDVAVHRETVEVPRIYAMLEGADEDVVDVYLKVAGTIPS